MTGKQKKLYLYVLVYGSLTCVVAQSTDSSKDDLKETHLFVSTVSSARVDVLTDMPNDTRTEFMPEDLATPVNKVEQARLFENTLKSFFKMLVKRILPMMMRQNSNTSMSKKCMRSFLKYIGGLATVKVWAVQMLDATSKPPAGIFEGTLTDFGGFDQCLEIMVPLRNGSEDFRGAYCAVEASPYMPPMPKNFSFARRKHAGPHDSIGAEILAAGGFFYYLKARFGVCVPSACTKEDLSIIVDSVGKLVRTHIKIPRCYVKEAVKFEPVQIAVIFALVLLSVFAVAGTTLEMIGNSRNSTESRTYVKLLVCFSLRSNCKRLISPSKGLMQLKSLHGIRALSIFWIVMGHSYIWSYSAPIRRTMVVQDWMNQLQMEPFLNAWLSVETFFLLSGLLVSYGYLQVLEKTKGRLNIPLHILRRYIRLTPSLMMVIGLAFLMPLVSSGPFWYELVDAELQSCRTNWWSSLLYISNWGSMRSVCIHPTWYLSADIQLYIISLVVIYALYRFTKLGFVVMGLATLLSSFAVGVITLLYDLPPLILVSSAEETRLSNTVDLIHIRTFTHLGPYFVGLLTGYLILKCKDCRLSKGACLIGWCASFTVSVASLYGAHTWVIGDRPGPLPTFLYASLHRTTYAAGVGWVIFACVTGRAGPITSFLSSAVLAAISRLAFSIYLVHSLVIWTRIASMRERVFLSHYNFLYESIGNFVASTILAILLHVLVEAPVSNLDRLLLSFATRKEELVNSPQGNGDSRGKERNGHDPPIQSFVPLSRVTVELKSVKALRQESNGKVKEYDHR